MNSLRTVNATHFLKAEKVNKASISNVNHNVTPNANVYYTPAQIQTAYELNTIVTPQNKPRGFGIKIAVIGCYHYANLQADLNNYCLNTGLTPITLNIINQASRAKDSGWAFEMCLDVQIINTVAPGATVYVIEAKSSSYANINVAINKAKNLGVNIITMSFGSSEFSSQSSMDNVYLNQNIFYCASSGDDIYASYPSTSANVCSIGGTSLYLDNLNARTSETTWPSAGVGVSRYTKKPTYQSNLPSIKRVIPDICAVANPATGFLVYCSIQGGWFSVGGTSLSCPLFAGIIAIANQLRKAQNKPMLSSVAASSTCVQKYLYKTILPSNSLYNTNIYDITSGSIGSFRALPSYDIATGLGSFRAALCSTLINI
jgi:subtilase family serine protease